MAFDRPTVSSRLLVASTIAALVVGLWPGVPAPTRAATSVFINEIHYDNASTDANEAIEVAGPAGTDLAGWSLVLYNGNGGAPYETKALTGTVPDQQNGYGTLSFDAVGLQNGSPDGVALVQGTTVVQFLSYEGSFAAVGGPANGMTSTDIGVSETGSEPLGQSLQLTGTGTTYEEFTWTGPVSASPGAVNAGQTFGGVSTGIAVFINEIHYDNASTDTGEAIEIAGPAGTSVTGWSLVLYNGSGGASYGSIPLSGSIPDQQNGFGTLTFAAVGLQNGSPDGIALVDGTNALIQFLSYEGMFAIVGGPFDTTESADIGVSESGSEPAGLSLQLVGTGTVYEDFSWATPKTATFGQPNSGQTFGTVVDAPVSVDCGGDLLVPETIGGTRTITASDADGTVTSIALESVTPPEAGITVGTTTPAPAIGGTASADLSVASTTSAGTYDVVISAQNGTGQSGTCSLQVTVRPILTIGEVQGSVSDTDDGTLHRSSFAPASGNGNGQNVYLRGVVTQRGRFPTASGGQNYGFWLQSRVGATDGDPNSSDGIFVFIGSFTTVLRDGGGPTWFPEVGDQVVLRGNVVEFFNLTELGSPRLVAIEDTGVDVDDPAQIETTEAAPDDDLADANRFWERHEGMRFHLDAGAHVVAARDVFPSTADGELWVIRGDHRIANRADPFARLVYRDTHPLDDIGPAGSFDNGNGMRIMLQSHGLKWAANDRELLIAPANTHDTVTNELTGALYFAFSKYGIEVEQQLDLEAGVDPAQNAPPQAADPDAEFATSDYNVENLYDFRDDPNDGCDFTGNAGCPGVSPPFDYVPASAEAYQKHLADLAAQIAGPMHAPDLLMIQEAEDQDICWVASGALACGTADDADGRPDTLQELALAISDAGGPTYEAVFDRDGADDRGIVSAFMYRTDTVELLAADAGDPVLGSAPTIEYRGAPLAYNADVQNPKAVNADLPADVDTSTGVDGSNVYTRPPQVGHFRVWRDGIGLSVFTDLYAISNHFSSTPDGRVGQRTEQAAYNAAIAEAILAADPKARIVSAGDFNVFPRPDDPFTPDSPRYPTDQLGPMYEAGLHNLWDTLVAEVPQSAYSYSFVGMAQTLDMQWADDNQFADLVQVRAAHINADFAADYDGDTARGASDHDPQVARWFTDVTFDRLHALVDHYVAVGELPADKAFLFHDRLDKAEAYVDQGKIRTAEAQLQAFGNQAYDYASATIAGALQKEANRLATLL